MLKRVDSPYLAGRKKGDWWKWKLDPLTVDAVMIYAQSVSGRRANLFTDFTFAVWDGNDLIPFTKAYSGLTDAEFRKITAWVRKTRWSVLARCAKSPHTMYSRSLSKVSNAAPGISQGWRFGFHACCAGAKTNLSRKPIRWTIWKICYAFTDSLRPPALALPEAGA